MINRRRTSILIFQRTSALKITLLLSRKKRSIYYTFELPLKETKKEEEEILLRNNT
jgi:hypothetical protein